MRVVVPCAYGVTVEYADRCDLPAAFPAMLPFTSDFAAPPRTPNHDGDALITRLLLEVVELVRPAMEAEDAHQFEGEFRRALQPTCRKMVAFAEVARAQGSVAEADYTHVDFAAAAEAWGGTDWSDAILDSSRAIRAGGRQLEALSRGAHEAELSEEHKVAIFNFVAANQVWFWCWSVSSLLVHEVVRPSPYAAHRVRRAMLASAREAWSSVRALHLREAEAPEQEELPGLSPSEDDRAMEASAEADGRASLARLGL